MQEQVTFNIVLTVEGVNAVLATLGKTPTESGLYPLFEDIRKQATEQARQQQKSADAQ